MDTDELPSKYNAIAIVSRSSDDQTTSESNKFGASLASSISTLARTAGFARLASCGRKKLVAGDLGDKWQQRINITTVHQAKCRNEWSDPAGEQIAWGVRYKRDV